MVTIKQEIDIDDLDNLLYGNAAEKWADADDDVREQIWSAIEDIFYSGNYTLTDLNDYVAFDCDEFFYPDEDEEE